MTAVADLSTFERVEEGVGQILKSLHGEMDILVNNVGFADVKSFDDLTDADWEKTFQVNFMSNIRVTRRLLPILRQRPNGSIVNNASDLGRQPEAIPADYGALKAAMLSVTKSVARAEGPWIRVNAVRLDRFGHRSGGRPEASPIRWQRCMECRRETQSITRCRCVASP
jgi:NAD(P)-dependent dehydrogenase (short-subunit alcohol dehydrogenase family)